MPRHPFPLTLEPLRLADLARFVEDDVVVVLGDDCQAAVERGRQVIDRILASGRTVYGVNTGFGKFAEVRIAPERVTDLQHRLILSHAAGVGPPMPVDVVRLMMLLKLHALTRGHSGVRPAVVELLAAMLNGYITPIIPAKGSVGASGDLAPLAHLALVMIGEGQAWLGREEPRETVSGREALRRAGLEPLRLAAKEGLAILNGTQAMSATLARALLQARNLLKTADVVGAMSLEALLGTLTPFDARIQALRPHPGASQVAANVRRVLAHSPIVASHRFSDHRVQDAYSLRCMPQVHGAVRDAVAHVETVLEREWFAVTDNPLIFPDDHEVLSGGNFHGEPIALAADYLGMALAELGSMSERRIEHMLDPAVSELAGFLTPDGGLNSGFMIAQVTAAALVSENKVLAHPASVDSIPTSANKEDHVSMGMHAARKAVEIAENVAHVLAIELLCATQALDLRAPLVPSHTTAAVRDRVRQHVPFWSEDRLIQHDLEAAHRLIQSGQVVRTAEAACGPLG